MEGPAVNVGGEAAPETVVVELAFKGSNEENEIETLDEFLTKVDGNEPASLDLSGWVFQAVDFSTLPAEQFLQYPLLHILFYFISLFLSTHFRLSNYKIIIAAGSTSVERRCGAACCPTE